MPSKKKKYNARFPAGRIKKIMQTDEEVGKVAQAVPIIISRTLELFVESLLTKTMMITASRNAKTLTPSHLKQCIQSESRFDFLKDLVRNIPDASVQEDNENNANFGEESPPVDSVQSATASISQPTVPLQVAAPQPNVSITHAQPAAATIVRTPVIQYQPRLEPSVSSNHSSDVSKVNVSVDTIIQNEEPKIHIDLENAVGSSLHPMLQISEPPPLVPIASSHANPNSDNLYIDEDYDN